MDRGRSTPPGRCVLVRITDPAHPLAAVRDITSPLAGGTSARSARGHRQKTDERRFVLRQSRSIGDACMMARAVFGGPKSSKFFSADRPAARAADGSVDQQRLLRGLSALCALHGSVIQSSHSGSLTGNRRCYCVAVSTLGTRIALCACAEVFTLDFSETLRSDPVRCPWHFHSCRCRP